MRIASLLPAATEWICALGAADALVGRSHACDFPPEVRDLPILTRPRMLPGSDSAAIDAHVRDSLQRSLSLYDVDFDRLRALHPDLIVTQAQCEVCAVSLADVEAALRSWTDDEIDVFSMQPLTLKQVFDVVLRLARRIGRLDAAMPLLAGGEARLRRLATHINAARTDTPTVACLEWIEPPMVAGHWMPDVVEQAGGQAMLAQKGEPSPTIAWDDLLAADPDIIAVMPCGFTMEQTRRDMAYLTNRPGWDDLRAVRQGRVVLFDGNAYFNRPGPRLYRAIDLLALALHHGLTTTALPLPEPWEMQAFASDS